MLFKSALSTSLPDLPSLTKPGHTPRKYEKLSYKKRIHEGELAPAPGTTLHAVAPISAPGPVRLPAIKTSVNRKPKKKHMDSDIFNIYNTTDHTVEYYEHDGHVYVSDSNRPWKEDCTCRNCGKSKKEWLDRKRRGNRVQAATYEEQSSEERVKGVTCEGAERRGVMNRCVNKCE